MRFTVELESIPVHFWQSYNGKIQYWAETGYQSQLFGTLEEAIATAKTEIAEFVTEFGCLPMFPFWIDNSWMNITEEF